MDNCWLSSCGKILILTILVGGLICELRASPIQHELLFIYLTATGICQVKIHGSIISKLDFVWWSVSYVLTDCQLDQVFSSLKGLILFYFTAYYSIYKCAGGSFSVSIFVTSVQLSSNSYVYIFALWNCSYYSTKWKVLYVYTWYMITVL